MKSGILTNYNTSSFQVHYQLNHLSNFLFNVLSFETCDQWVFVDFPTWDRCSDRSPAGR